MSASLASSRTTLCIDALVHFPPLLQYWDGDRFEHIHSLEGHKGELWALATAPDGSYLVSGGHDRSLRIWRRSEEQVFLDEEREREAEAMVRDCRMQTRTQTPVPACTI